MQKHNNKNAHSTYGNKMSEGNLKLLLTNKGSSYFENKVDDMSYIIDKYSPHIMCISEANIKQNYMPYINEFSNYHFELNLMSDTCNVSRNSIIV